MLAILAVAAIALPGATPDTDPAYWERKPGCAAAYGDRRAHRVLRYLLHRPRPLRPAQRRRLRNARVCALDRESRRRRERHARKLRRWRVAYPQVWTIRFYRLDPGLQAWAWSTSSCETGGTLDPATSTGNGFYGAFQWVPSTWWAAGGDRWPTLASWHHQAVLAVRFMLRHGAQHWPVCG